MDLKWANRQEDGKESTGREKGQKGYGLRKEKR
jgi:hypothetical protein